MSAVQWNLQRDPELSREAPVPRTTGTEAARQRFLGAIQEGRDVFLPAAEGPDRLLSWHLGELCQEARGLLLKAAHEAMNGHPHTASEYLRDALRAEANYYADNNEEAFLP